MSKYLIVGNSAGAIAAVEAIREVDRSGAITLVSDEPGPAYSRPAIAEFLMGERTFDHRMMIRDDAFYQRNAVQCRLGARVARLDVSKRQALLNSGERLSWERLLLATGGTPIVPPMDGLGLDGIYSFVTIDDARNIDAYLRQGKKRVIIIGGGLIGCSLAHALLRRGGVQVSLVELKERILSTMMDAEASRMVEQRLKELGVDLHTGRSVVRVLPSTDGKSAAGVALDNGVELACDVVGMAVGVKPRVELAQGTPIKVNRGIVVDKHMETTVRGVYACGDVAEAYDFIYDGNRVVAIWPNAFIGGRVAGFNMAGEEQEYDGCTAMNAFSYFGLALASAGRFDPSPDDQCQTMATRRNGSYKRAVLHKGKLVGFVLMGDIEQSGVLYRLMREQVEVTGFQDRLLADNFSLVALPKDLRKTWLGADGKTLSSQRA